MHTINCEINLSKKLRKMIADGATIALTTHGLKDGRAIGALMIETEDSVEIDPEVLNKETSIGITLKEDVAEMPDTNKSVINLFSTLPSKNENTPISKMAAVHAPEKNEVPDAIVSKEEKMVPEPYEKSEFRNFVSNVEQFMDELIQAKNRLKKGEIDLIDVDKIENPRQKAIAIAENESAMGLGVPAFVTNEACANLSINDLDLNLRMGDVYNLARIPADKLFASGDLRALLSAEALKFVSPQEAAEKSKAFMEKAVPKNKGLQAFSGPNASDLARASFEASDDEVLVSDDVPRGNIMDVTEENMDYVADEDNDFVELVGSMSDIRDTSVEIESGDGRRVTSHSSKSQTFKPEKTMVRQTATPSQPRQHTPISRI